LIIRFICLTIASFLALAFRVDAQGSDAPFSNIEASVEIHGEAPYVGEPLRLVIRSAIHAQVANDRIIQPDLTDFDWQQFGVDSTKQELIDGFWMPVVTRVLMIYPLRAGKLTLNAFKRRVTYFSPDGERKETEISSSPVSIDVQSHEALTGKDAYWIPAKDFRITDQWSPEPDKIAFEETAQRTITLEADGLTADRLPNLPSFRAPGVITFAGPVQRETIITDQGPLGRIIYRWRIRPVSQAVATAPPVKIRWFDISRRQMREAVLPERRVAYLGGIQERKSTQTLKLSDYLSSQSLLAFILAFIMMGAASFLFISCQLHDTVFWRSLFTSAGLFVSLFISALRGDRVRFYALLKKLKKTDPLIWRIIEDREDYSGFVNNLEATIYGRRPVTKSDRLLKYAFAIFKIYLKTLMQRGRRRSSGTIPL